jgi:nucleoside permease NupC
MRTYEPSRWSSVRARNLIFALSKIVNELLLLGDGKVVTCFNRCLTSHLRMNFFMNLLEKIIFIKAMIFMQERHNFADELLPIDRF